MIITFRDKQDYIKWVTDNIEKNNKEFDKLAEEGMSLQKSWGNMSVIGKCLYKISLLWSRTNYQTVLNNIGDRQQQLLNANAGGIRAIDTLKYFPDNVAITVEVNV